MNWANSFFDWTEVLFWLIFLTGLTGSILAILWHLVRNWRFGQDTVFMRKLLWIVLASFFCPVLFCYWQQKEGGLAFQYEMFRSAGALAILINLIVLIWVAGAVKKTIGSIRQLRLLHQLKAEANNHLSAQSQADLLCASMNVRRPVTVLKSSEIISPMTISFFHPYIFLPEGTIDEENMRLILVHELTHIKHRDFLMKQLMLVISSLYWFCPGVKQLFHDINVCNEYYCDLESIEQLKIEGQEYFSRIRAFAAEQKRLRAYAYSALCENKNTLKARERAAKQTKLARENHKFTAGKRLIAVALIGIVLCTSAYTISFASVVGYDATMKFLTTEKAEYQNKQKIIDAASLIFTGDEIKSDELFAKEALSGYGSNEQKWTLEKGEQIQLGPFYKEKGASIWIYTYANYPVEYGIVCDTNKRCLEGKNEGHNFEINESGFYYVFVRNWSGERTEGGSLVVQ